jgi:hypothetical protein
MHEGRERERERERETLQFSHQADVIDINITVECRARYFLNLKCVIVTVAVIYKKFKIAVRMREDIKPRRFTFGT